jgi:hypothetical protein
MIYNTKIATSHNIYFSEKQIANALGGDVTGPNKVIAPGPGHSRSDRSLSILISSTGKIIVHSFSGQDWKLCHDYVIEALGISKDLLRAVLPADPATGHRPSSDSAIQLWTEAEHIGGTLAELYFYSRGLTVPKTAHDALRFHPRCPFGSGNRYPSLLALYRDIQTDEPKAISRTALTATGGKIGRKVLGPKSGCAIKLSPHDSVTLGLTIGEGVETVLGGMSEGFYPAWALGDASELAKFPFLQGTETLTILVDNDESGTGNRSAIAFSQRWTAAGAEVRRVIPDTVGADMADIASKRGV